MDKDDVVYVYVHIHIMEYVLLSHMEDSNLAICDNTDGPWGHYTKLNQTKKTNITEYNLDMESKKAKLLKTE